jgi:hypothetical protein
MINKNEYNKYKFSKEDKYTVDNYNINFTYIYVNNDEIKNIIKKNEKIEKNKINQTQLLSLIVNNKKNSLIDNKRNKIKLKSIGLYQDKKNIKNINIIKDIEIEPVIKYFQNLNNILIIYEIIDSDKLSFKKKDNDKKTTKRIYLNNNKTRKRK